MGQSDLKKNIIKMLLLLNMDKDVLDTKLYGSSSRFLLIFFCKNIEIFAIIFINFVRKIIKESIDLQRYTNLEFSV